MVTPVHVPVTDNKCVVNAATNALATAGAACALNAVYICGAGGTPGTTTIFTPPGAPPGGGIPGLNVFPVQYATIPNAAGIHVAGVTGACPAAFAILNEDLNPDSIGDGVNPIGVAPGTNDGNADCTDA